MRAKVVASAALLVALTVLYMYTARVRDLEAAGGNGGGLCPGLQGRAIPPGMLSHHCINFVLLSAPPMGKDGLVQGHDMSILHSLDQLLEAMNVFPLSCFTVTLAAARIDDNEAWSEARKLYGSDPRFRFLHTTGAHNDAELVLSALTTAHCEVCGREAESSSGDTAEAHRVSEKIVLLETNAQLCDNTVVHLMYAIERANRDTAAGWSSLRVHDELAGVVLQCRDLPAIIRYGTSKGKAASLRAMMRVLTHFWYRDNKEGQAHFGMREPVTYRYNLFKKRVGKEGRIEHDCYDTLVTARAKDFQPWCHHTDLSPCNRVQGKTFFEQAQSNGERYLAEDNPHPFLISPYYTQTYAPFHPEDYSTVTLAKSKQGEDCAAVCAREKLQCLNEYLPYLNHCQALQENFGCGECLIADDRGKAYPGVAMAQDKTCFVSPIRLALSCDGSQEDMTRLCPCATTATTHADADDEE